MSHGLEKFMKLFSWQLKVSMAQLKSATVVKYTPTIPFPYPFPYPYAIQKMASIDGNIDDSEK
jgi:hypothetical protein